MESFLVGTFSVVLQAYAVAYLVYLWVPAVAALAAWCRPKARVEGSPRRERSFAILISAHNEESVIGSLLWSLALQHYPQDRRRVFVAANNCTDSTAAVVRNSGMAMCYERAGEGLATKGIALAWLWERVSHEAADADTVLILDADNLVPPDFLCELNRTLDRGYQVVQAARRAKNAEDSWSSQLDSISEALWHRLDQIGRMHLGLSAILSGSGMAFERSVFEGLISSGQQGLCEDVEWQARLTLAGTKVGYAELARVYDEKTSRVGQLSRQRKRWFAGIAVTARGLGLQLLASGIRSRDVHMLVGGFGATKPPRSVMVVLLGLMVLGGWLFPATPALLPWPLWAGALGSLVIYMLLGMAMDHALARAYLALVYSPIFLMVVIGAATLGSLRASREQWVPTTHKRGMTMDQMHER